jgi:hypothetical protein
MVPLLQNRGRKLRGGGWGGWVFFRGLEAESKSIQMCLFQTDYLTIEVKEEYPVRQLQF